MADYLHELDLVLLGTDANLLRHKGRVFVNVKLMRRTTGLNDENGMLAGNAGAVVPEAEYLRIAKAAGALGCSPDDLLHLGAIGKAELLAPMFDEGVYEWHVSADDGEPYPEDEPGFRTTIGLKDRVVLLAEDLAKMEAIGWARPTVFFYPSKGREIARHWNKETFLKELAEAAKLHLAHECLWRNKFYYPNTVCASQASEEGLDGSFQKKLEDNAITVPWILEDPFEWGPVPIDVQSAHGGHVKSARESAGRTTIENLFLSKEEFMRLKGGSPQDEAVRLRKDVSAEPNKPHGNARRFSSEREQILRAAIACYFKDNKERPSGASWAKMIDDHAWKCWASGAPPNEPEQITVLLNEAMKFPEVKWDGKKVKKDN